MNRPTDHQAIWGWNKEAWIIYLLMRHTPLPRKWTLTSHCPFAQVGQTVLSVNGTSVADLGLSDHVRFKSYLATIKTRYVHDNTSNHHQSHLLILIIAPRQTNNICSFRIHPSRSPLRGHGGVGGRSVT